MSMSSHSRRRSFNSFMAKKKKPTRTGSSDELALVKAAAWAWYQRGSGSEGKPMAEFDHAARTHRISVSYKPSRYKLEAMKISSPEQEAAEEHEKDTNIITPDQNNKNSLLDKYEIESISKRFDQLVSQESKNDSQNREKSKKTTKKSSSGGSWLMRQAAVCGTKKDAVVDATVSRRPGKPAPTVVKLATCRPRVTHDLRSIY